MGKREKLLERFLKEPADFSWDELVTLLSHFGFQELKTQKSSGSSRKFVDGHVNIINGLHKPHGSSAVKKYQFKLVKTLLERLGKI